METPELCRYCEAQTPLTECVVQAHWERRLKAVNLPEDRAKRALMRDGSGELVDRNSPLTGKYSEFRGVPLVLPEDPDIAEAFVADCLRPVLSQTRRFWPNAQEPNPSVRHRVTC